MQSHEHTMSTSVENHETTLELLNDATSGFTYADRDIKCRHCGETIVVDRYSSWVHQDTNDETCEAHIPADFPVRPLIGPRAEHEATDMVTCGTCGLSWDDSIATSWTPVPSGRCPFEYFHTEATPDESFISTLESVGIDVDDMEESATSAMDNYALDVETEIILTVTLAVGGPTQYLSAPIERDQYGTWERTGRVTYVDSWAVPSETVLSDDTMLVTLFDRYVETYSPDQ